MHPQWFQQSHRGLFATIRSFAQRLWGFPAEPLLVPELGIDPGGNMLSREALAAMPLRTSASRLDLGVVDPRSAMTASFRLTNVTDQPITLHSGPPGCGCESVELSRSAVPAYESATLEMRIRSGDRYAGPRTGCATVGTSVSDAAVMLEARGLVEGMTTYPRSIRLPKQLERFVPPPLAGEFVLGPKRHRSEVKIVHVLIGGDSAGAITAGEAKIEPAEDLGTYHRRRFEIPLAISRDAPPETKLYGVRITYRIGRDIYDHTLSLPVFPLAEVPSGH